MTAAYTTYKTFEGDQAALEERNALVMQELPQVYFIAARILERLPQHVEIEDLVNAGVIGLLEACQTYDGTKNAQFKTFAKFRIRGAILDSLRVLDWGSRGLRRKAREITEATSKLAGTLARQPSKEEIAKEMQLTPAQLDDAMTQLQGLHIVGQQAASFDGEDVYDVIEAAPSSWENPFELYCKEEERAQLAAAVAELSEREQLILSLYYVEELTMKEVAVVVGVALSRVSQIHYAALSKLKRTLGHLQPEPEPGMESAPQQKVNRAAAPNPGGPQ
jgi:RNA polymerase sigma factor for flagellar operon FliA